MLLLEFLIYEIGQLTFKKTFNLAVYMDCL